MAESEDLHPYDGKQRRFVDDDDDPLVRARGVALVVRVLGLTEPPRVGLRYDLSFYSGGIGVFDRLAVSMPVSASEIDAIAAGLGMLPPAELSDSEDRESLDWLVLDEDHAERSLDESVLAFLADQRRPFQSAPRPASRVWVTPGSGVNDWSMIYEVEGELAFLAYAQG
ncbi:hypothetical protein ACNOYE_28970 [Nannocystaceae bacterium ST9]